MISLITVVSDLGSIIDPNKIAVISRKKIQYPPMVMLSFFSTGMKSIGARATSQRLRDVLQWYFFSIVTCKRFIVISSEDIHKIFRRSFQRITFQFSGVVLKYELTTHLIDKGVTQRQLPTIACVVVHSTTERPSRALRRKKKTPLAPRSFHQVELQWNFSFWHWLPTSASP